MKKIFKKYIKVTMIFMLSIIVMSNYNLVTARITQNLPISELRDDFPNSYKPYIETLKKNHPNWVFKAVYTNLDWNLVLTHESYEVNPEISLINKYDYSEKWLYNGDNIAHDGPFYTASKSAVAFALDPRNFISETGIFQFETLSYSSNVHSVNSVEKVLAGTKMASEEYKNKYKFKGEWIEMSETYSEMIVRLSKKYNISPTHVASRIRQENSGNVVDGALINGDRGVYNFFNIGAIPGTDGNSAVTNGLNYAEKNGWTNPEKSIEAGIAVLVKNYIQYGQDTIYFQKFDVNNPYGNASWLFASQYMTNIMAPANESKSAYNGYIKSGMINSDFEFHIPVYDNMPEKACPSPEDDIHYNEFVTIKGNTYYYNDKGEKVTGWQEIDSLTYYFDKSGVMLKGINEVDGKKYFFGVTKGKLMKGWVDYNGLTYYMDEKTGEVSSGITRINGKDYFFGIRTNKLMKGLIDDNGTLYYTNNEGLLQTGMIQVDENWYYFGKDYIAISGWKEIEGLTYYFEPTTKIRAKGITEVNGKKYFFGITKGKMMKGWLDYDGLTYYMDEETGEVSSGITEVDGKTYFFGIKTNKLMKGWLDYNGFTYYMDEKTGEMASKVKIIDKKPYYFDPDTKGLLKGIINNNGELYYTNDDSVLQTGMIELNGNWYYFGERYNAEGGFKEIDLLTYYFDPVTKIRASGITEVNGKKYFFGITKGKMMKGWLDYDGLTYYMNETTGEMASGVTNVNGKDYFFGIRTNKLMRGLIDHNGTLYYTNNDGLLQTGMLQIGDNWYYFGRDYKAVSGLKEIDSLTYYFDPVTKIRAKGITEVNGKKYFFGITKGKMMKGWLDYDGLIYYMNETTGEMASGVTRVNGKDYFFGIRTNKLMRGLIDYNGTLYYTNNDGLLQKGMIQLGENWYYFGNDYIAVSGLKEIDSLTYYFNPVTKIRAKGITEVNGKKYFFGITKGKMMKGWLDYDGLTYYMDEKTGEMASGITRVNGKDYFFGIKTNKLMKGLIEYNGELYYTNNEGLLQIGKHTINGITYDFDEKTYKAK